MYKPRLRDIVEWRGKLAMIIGLADRPTVSLKVIEPEHCPNCNHCLGQRQVSGVVITSPMFQEGVKPVQTIQTEDELRQVE